MMGHQTISPVGLELRRRRPAPTAKRHRLLLSAVILSIVVHLAATLLVVLLPRILPKDAQPQEQGTIELLMVEQKGAIPSQAGTPNDSTPTPKPPESTPAPKVEDSQDQTLTPQPKAAPAPSATERGNEPAPPPSEQANSNAAAANAAPSEHETEAQPLPPRSKEAPVFDLGGTDSESNATALGGQILPAMKDDRFRNRPPVYPIEAEIHGEHGSVVLVIHVSESGMATGADVLESSGYEVLDQAAVTAVRKWHFHAAMKKGRPVPFDMPFRFIFEPY
jgi:protein TonB